MKKLINFNEIQSMTKGMTTKEKVRYILQYYWVPIAIVLGVIIAAIYLSYRIFFTAGDYWFFLLYTNTRENVGNHSPIWDEYVELTGYDTKQKNVEFNTNCFFDASVKGGTNNSYYQAFVAYVESKSLDAVIGSESSLIEVGASGRLLDLEDESCKSIYEKYKDRLVYCTPNDEDYEKSQVAVAIDISDSRLITEYAAYPEGEKYVLGIGAYAQHLEAVEYYLDMILEEE